MFEWFKSKPPFKTRLNNIIHELRTNFKLSFMYLEDGDTNYQGFYNNSKIKNI